MAISHKKAFKYLQYYLDNKISPKADLLLKEHLKTCDSCKNIFDLQKTLAAYNPWKNEGSSPARINQTIELVQKDQRSFLMFSKLSKSVKFLSIATIAVALITLFSWATITLIPSPANEQSSIGSNETLSGDSTAIPEQQVLTEDSAAEFSELNTVGEYIRPLDIENNLMLVGINSNLKLFDIQDPLELKTLSSFQLDSWISAVAIKLPYAYIALGDGTVVLLDISIPSSPSIYFQVPKPDYLGAGYFSKIIIPNTDDQNDAYFIWHYFSKPLYEGEAISNVVHIAGFAVRDLNSLSIMEFTYFDLPYLNILISGD